MATPTDKAQIWGRLASDFDYFCESCLFIRTVVDANGNPVYVRDGGPRIKINEDPDDDLPVTSAGHARIPFRLNSLQRALLRVIQAQEAANVPQRVWILKSRKEGLSTLIQALAFWRCCFRQGYEVNTWAHLDDSTKKIAEIAKRFNENLPKVVVPRIGARSVGHELKWTHGSMMETRTARSTEAGRSGSPSMLHLSEVALYEVNRDKTSAESMLQGTLNAVDEIPGTCIIGETTSNGPGGAFYKRYLASVEGKSNWAHVFFSWKDSEKYAFPVTEQDAAMDVAMRAAIQAGDEAKGRGIAKQLGYDDVWTQRALEYGLTPPQVRWAMSAVTDKGGDLTRFDREFPISWRIAFSSAGRLVFPQVLLDDWLHRKLPEETVLGRAFFRDESGQIRLDGAGSRWYIFKPPEPTHEYVLGNDTAQGLSEDASSIEIFDHNTGEQVAEWVCDTAVPEETAEQIMLSARLYNNAFVIPEAKEAGLVVLKCLVDWKVPNIYNRKASRDVRPGPDWIKSLGFATTPGTRNDLINEFVADVRTGRLKMNSPRFFHEALVYERDADGRPDHPKGGHDDTIIGSALAAVGHRLRPKVELSSEPADDWWTRGRMRARRRGRDQQPQGGIGLSGAMYGGGVN